jgi:hypothetical protein
LLCQAAYESQLTEEREERHDAVARVLLRGGASGRAADAAVVAYHFDRAHEPIEAVTQYLAAATHAQGVGAVPEVMVHLHRADVLLDQVVGPARAPLELALRLCRAPATSAVAGYGDSSSALDYEKSVELCRQLKDTAGMETGVLRALLGVWCYYYATGDLAQSQLVTGAMEEQLEVATLPAGRPSFHACKGVELFCAGDLPSAEGHFRAAIELFADDDVDPAQWPLPNDPLGAVFAFLSPLQLFWGDEEGALVAATAGVERCRDLEFPRGPFTVAFVRTYEAWMHRERGVPDAAIAAAEEVIELGDRHGFFDWVAAGRIQRLAAMLAMEPSVPLLDELGDAIRAFRINGEEWILSSLLIDRGWGYLALGDLDQVESCLLETQEVLDHGQKTSLAEAHRLQAELMARRSGPHDPAVAHQLRAGMRFAIDQGAHLFVLRCGASYERWLGLDGLDADLRQTYEEATARFGPTLEGRERFLRRCGPDASMNPAGVQPTPAG